MAKRVLVIASGETERRALPHLVRHLRESGAVAADVRIPPRGRELDAAMAERLVKSAWYENPGARPDKFVVVKDLDGKDPVTMEPFRNRLLERLTEIGVDVLFAYAQQHLEAWYFADAAQLRAYLGRAPGSVDTSRPDEIENPKLHLKHVLGDRPYTARVSAEIAEMLDADTIAGRSPSFGNFLAAMTNGRSDPERVSGHGPRP